jgi:hypothetical protein
MTLARHRPEMFRVMTVVGLMILTITGCGSGSDRAERKTSARGDQTAGDSFSQ